MNYILEQTANSTDLLMERYTERLQKLIGNLKTGRRGDKTRVIFLPYIRSNVVVSTFDDSDIEVSTFKL